LSAAEKWSDNHMKISRRILVTLATLACLTAAALPSIAHGQERGATKATVGKANVSIDYGRPELKGRDMLGKMQAGAVWRIGANEATTLTTDADLDFAGKKLAKGKHILLTRLGEGGKWSLIASTKGAFQFEESGILGEIPLTLTQAKESVEALTINLTGQGDKGTIEITWGTSRLTGTFTCAK
jgi:hypothetical protein